MVALTEPNEVDELLRKHAVVPDRREVWEWAGGTSPDYNDAEVNFAPGTVTMPGRYDVENVPWTKEFLRACNDPRVREVTFVAPPQDSGKTKAAEVYLGYRIKNAPCNMAFNISTNVKAEQWSETRWAQILEAVKGIKEKFSDNIHQKKTRRIVFKDGTFLLIQGAETKGNRAGDSVEVQVNDELNLWERPWVREMHERTNASRAIRKIINISVAGKKGSELHERFLAGNQLEWHHVCEKCDTPFDYVFDHKNPRCNIRFDVSKAVLHADGRLDLREFAPTIYVECQNPVCKTKMHYDPERMRRLNRKGIYIARNPDADADTVSLHVNSFAIGVEPWVKILEPWVRMFIRGGVFLQEQLEEFITKKLAEFWDEKPHAVTTELKLAGWTRLEILKREWKEEGFRVMGLDNQRGRQGDIPHRWFAAGAFSATGKIRIFDAGRINEWPDVKKKQVELEIPNPTLDKPGPFVLCDRRYEPVTVDEMTHLYKWYGTLGTDVEEFVHPPWSPFAGSRQLFSEMRSIDIGFGTAEAGRSAAMYYLWCSQKLQDLVAELRNSNMIEFARDSGDWAPELPIHMNSHKQFMELDKKGNERRMWKRLGDMPDHLYDCITQIVLIGCMAGIYKKE
jgi:hypothetical protein